MKGIALAFVLLLAAGCSSLPFGEDEDDFRVPLVCLPEHERLPCGDGVVRDVQYPFNLQTHCGIEWAYFDGRYWVPPRRIDPPSDWAAITAGTMTLRAPDDALFRGPGSDVAFVRAPEGYEPPPCA